MSVKLPQQYVRHPDESLGIESLNMTVVVGECEGEEKKGSHCQGSPRQR